MTGSEPPRIALAIFRLAPAGGLEQHALRLAADLVERGAGVTLVTTQPPAPAAPKGVVVETLPTRGRSNHGRLAAFAEDAGRAVRGRFDVSVACHMIPGFDTIFCADPSRARPGGVKALLPRYRTYAELERRALAADGAKRVLTLSSAQRAGFLANNAVAHPERLSLLPPTVDRARSKPGPPKPKARATLGLPSDGPVWLWMGLQPRTKGLDRVLDALAATPAARLVVCGLDPASKAGAAAVRSAERLGAKNRVLWLGFAREAQLGEALAAADILVHPSRADVTGTVILEAMASGLPVITTAVCGYGEHVEAAGAGVVLPEPFEAAALLAALRGATPEVSAAWSTRALTYAARDELYSGLDRASELILELASRP